MGFQWWRKRWQSRILAFLVDLKAPRPLVRRAIEGMIRHYGVDLGDSVRSLDQFESVDDFFTRAMRPETRPIDPRPDLMVSPVDGTVQGWGGVGENGFLQAKGISYPLQKLIPDERAARLEGGDSITIYLSPRDGHRIFSPCEGRVVGSCHVPGLLYMVREPYVSEVDGLYALNERLITFMETALGLVAVVKVAALNVARITAVYDPEICTNRGRRVIRKKTYDRPVAIGRGDHLGTFHLGSTVIIVAEKGVLGTPLKKVGDKLRYGEALVPTRRG